MLSAIFIRGGDPYRTGQLHLQHFFSRGCLAVWERCLYGHEGISILDELRVKPRGNCNSVRISLSSPAPIDVLLKNRARGFELEWDWRNLRLCCLCQSREGRIQQDIGQRGWYDLLDPWRRRFFFLFRGFDGDFVSMLACVFVFQICVYKSRYMYYVWRYDMIYPYILS